MSTKLGMIGVIDSRRIERKHADSLKIDISSMRLDVEQLVWWPAPGGGSAQQA